MDMTGKLNANANKKVSGCSMMREKVRADVHVILSKCECVWIMDVVMASSFV